MPSRSPFRFFLSIFFSFFRFFIFARVFSATLRSSPGTREIFVRIKAPGINIPWSREGVARGRKLQGVGGGSSRRGPGGCVRASLARETTGALPPLCLPTPSPPHLSKLTPFLSFSRPAHSFFVLLSLVLSLSCFPFAFYSALPRPFGTSTALESRSFSPVSRFPRPPSSFLYTTSFAVVGEGETPAFAVGEAVLFFPLIKADRCGSGCRDDGTGVGGGRYTGRVARGCEETDDGLRWLEEGGGEPGTA